MVTATEASVRQVADRRMITILSVAVLPWIAVVLWTAGPLAALHFAGYALVILCVGYGIAGLALPATSRSEAILLAPALGILAISGLTAIWLRMGLSIGWVPALWLVILVPGAIWLGFDRTRLIAARAQYGITFAILSLVICLVYFVPAAHNDAVVRSDGSFNWIYVDTQHFYGIASAIKYGQSPPRTPGTDTAELLYHFGPYAPAAVISHLDGLPLGDALVRITNGAWLFALVLACFELGTRLSLKATGAKFGGLMSVAGLFFYGALLALFTDERNSASHVGGAILFTIPRIGVLADGGPFSHLILGHSVLHGLGAIVAIMGLCLVARESDSSLGWREIVPAALPALAVPVDSVAALYCVGVAAILLLWGRLGKARTWILMALTVALFLAAWRVMGYAHATDAAGAHFSALSIDKWWPVTVAFIVGLGIRILGFQWISRPLKDPVAALVAASVVGLASFFVFLQIRDGNERYGIYFLQAMFSIFAFSRLTAGFWRDPQRSELMKAWLRVGAIGMVVLVAWGGALIVISHLRHQHSGINDFRLTLSLAAGVAVVLGCLAVVMKRSESIAGPASALLLGILLVGFLGWIPSWLNFGMDRMKMDVTLSSGEVQGLQRLKALSAAGDEFATNKHSIDGLAMRKERSYAYAALAERPVLLEGYLDRGEYFLPYFQTLLDDNDLMFATTDANVLHKDAQTWHVRWLVARPGTDISLPRPLPSWLTEEQDTGDLKIYKID